MRPEGRGQASVGQDGRKDVMGESTDPFGELARRREAPLALPDYAETGWLSIYRRTVRPLGEGAVLAAPSPDPQSSGGRR